MLGCMDPRSGSVVPLSESTTIDVLSAPAGSVVFAAGSGGGGGCGRCIILEMLLVSEFMVDGIRQPGGARAHSQGRNVQRDGPRSPSSGDTEDQETPHTTHHTRTRSSLQTAHLCDIRSPCRLWRRPGVRPGRRAPEDASRIHRARDDEDGQKCTPTHRQPPHCRTYAHDTPHDASGLAHRRPGAVCRAAPLTRDGRPGIILGKARKGVREEVSRPFLSGIWPS